MAAAETARLIASLELQDKNFTRGIRNVERGVNRVDRKLGAFSGFVNRNMGRAIDSIALRFTQSIGTGLESLAELEDATTAVTGSITQVGKDWTTTGEDIAKWANEIEADTEAAFDDKAIVQATNTLIRYGKVSENNLRPAMEVMTDLAAKTGDEGSAATLLARALADPAKAAGKLARAGVILTKAQQKQIKAMVKTGDVAGAQTLLLEILSETTKDAAKNSAGPYRDAMNQLRDATEDAQRALAVGFLPIIKEVSGVLTKELGKPETINALKGLGTALAGTLRSLIGAAKQLPWQQIGDSLRIAGMGAKAMLDAFLGLPPWIQTAVLTGWGLNKLTGGKLFDVGKIAFDFLKGRGSTPANPLFVTDVTKGLGGGAPVPGGAKGGPLAALKGVIVDLGTAVTGLGLTAAAGLTIAAIAPIALFGLTKAIIDATGKPIPERELEGRQETAERRGVPERNRPTKPGDIPRGGLSGDALKRFEARVNGASTALKKLETRAGGAPGAFRPPPAPPAGARPTAGQPKPVKPGDNLFKQINDFKTKQQGTINQIKNAQSIASRENSAQRDELARIKNTTETGLAQQKAALIAQTAVNTAGNIAAAFQSAGQILAQGSTTSAVNTNATATRGVAPPITAAVYSIGAQISGSIAANRPVIQSTNVVNNYTTQQRTGSSSGSRYNRWE